MRAIVLTLGLLWAGVLAVSATDTPETKTGGALNVEPIFQIDSVVIGQQRTPDVLTLCLEGTASTPGFQNIRLELAASAHQNGVYDLSFVGDAPKGVMAQVLTPVAITHSWRGYPADLKAVRIIAKTNEIMVALDQSGKDCAVPTGVPSPKPTQASLIGGVWLAEDIRGGGVIDRAQSTLAFKENGGVTGSGGCNRFVGSATIREQSLSIGPLATTKMACAPALMDQEQKFLSALEAAKSYAFDGAFLRLIDGNGTVLVRLTRLEEKPK